MRYPHLWTRLYGCPLLIHPDKAAIIESAFRAHESGEHTIRFATNGELPAEALLQPHRAESAVSAKVKRREDKPYAMTDSGIAVIPVLGTLIQRGDFFSAMSGMTSYNRLESLLDRAVEDADVRAILLEVDSFGGEANGMIDLADKIFAAREFKPVWTHINEQAYSAGYGLASAGEKVFIPRTGGTGSIGTIMLHIDQSQRDAKQGYVYTFIYAGARKKDFNSHEPLSDRAREDAQAEVDRINDLFIGSVAGKRGLAEDVVRGTEAGLLSPAAAVDGGFADGIATFGETLAMLDEHLKTRLHGFTFGTRMAADRSTPAAQPSKENHMTTNTAAKEFTQADFDNARQEGATKGKAEGVIEGRAAERARIDAIMQCDEAKERPVASARLALQTAMSVDETKQLLASLPKESAPVAGANQFAAAMNVLGNPRVGVDDPDAVAAAASAAKPVIDAAQIFAARAAAAQKH